MDLLPFEVEDDGAAAPGATLASNLLIVDDEVVVLDVFQRLLAREPDVAVTVVEDAERAVELLREQRFDLLITDKNLPGMGGIELIAEARGLQPTLEAIMITGYASAESVIAALAAGASDYLVKPFDDLRVVRAKVRAALERKTQRAKNREMARSMAKHASELLGQGRDADEGAWRRLETAFAEYERAIREGGEGSVLVLGSATVVQTLAVNGFYAQQVGEDSPLLRFADVVVIETGRGDWRPSAERLQGMSPDLLLLASEESDLGDLLEALSLHVDLIGFGGRAPAQALPDRIRAVLVRRAVERAQADLAAALGAFREALRGGGNSGGNGGGARGRGA